MCDREFGLSQFIEVDGKTILFDAGMTDLYIKNADGMSIDLSGIDYIALSHGHNDHGNGLIYFPCHKPLILHPDCFIKRYCEQEYAGLSFEEKDIADRFEIVKTKVAYQIIDNAWFLGEIPRETNFELNNDKFKTQDGSTDLLLDDTGIVIKTSEGLVILSGCAHSGICNIIEYAKQIAGESIVHTVIGGFHLGFGGSGIDEKAKRTIEYFADNGIQNAYLGHCTSDDVILAFKNELTNCHVKMLSVGTVIEI